MPSNKFDALNIQNNLSHDIFKCGKDLIYKAKKRRSKLPCWDHLSTDAFFGDYSMCDCLRRQSIWELYSYLFSFSFFYTADAMDVSDRNSSYFVPFIIEITMFHDSSLLRRFCKICLLTIWELEHLSKNWDWNNSRFSREIDINSLKEAVLIAALCHGNVYI